VWLFGHGRDLSRSHTARLFGPPKADLLSVVWRRDASSISARAPDLSDDRLSDFGTPPAASRNLTSRRIRLPTREKQSALWRSRCEGRLAHKSLGLDVGRLIQSTASCAGPFSDYRSGRSCKTGTTVTVLAKTPQRPDERRRGALEGRGEPHRALNETLELGPRHQKAQEQGAAGAQTRGTALFSPRGRERTTVRREALDERSLGRADPPPIS
jgi:hypothetical protein